MVTAKTKRTIDTVVPVFSVESDQLILQDGRVAVGFAVGGIETEKLTAHQYDSLNTLLYNALKTLPEGTVVQKIDAFYYKAYQASKKDKTYFHNRTTEHFEERPILLHRAYLFLSVGPLGERERNAANTFFAMGKSVLNNPFDQLEQRQSAIEYLAQDFISTLASFEGISLNRLTNDELQNLYLQYINLEFDPDHQPTDAVRTFAPATTHAALGEKRINIVTLSGQGSPMEPFAPNKQTIMSPWVYPLLHPLYFPHLLSVSLKILNREKVLSGMDTTAKVIKNLDFMMTQDNMIKREELLDFTREVRAENKNIVSANVSLILHSAHETEVDYQLQKAVSAFRDMGSAECFIESLDTANLFIANAPGNSNQNYRWLVMSGDNGAMYLNFVTQYRSALRGDLLCDRNGVPVLLNLFNTDLQNQNALVIGPTGSGKSFTMAWFLLQRFERGEPQIIIDVGGTYLSLSTALGGRYFEYDPDRPLRFNPFLVPRQSDGTYSMQNDKLNFLTNLLLVIWKGTEGTVRQSERSVLTELIVTYYQQYNQAVNPASLPPTLLGFYEFLLDYIEGTAPENEFKKQVGSFNFSDFLLCLKPFATGQYKDILNAPEHEDLAGHPLIVFDMKRIKSNPMLYPIIGMLITELAADQLARYPDISKWIYMDEAWSMLSETMTDFIELMYRTIRKNKGSMTIITQGIHEIQRSPIGKAILVNADTKYILRHNDAQEVETVGKALAFTQHEKQKILSLALKETYREIFIKQGEYGKVFRLEVPFAVQAVLTSKPDERNTLRGLTEAYDGDIYAAIRQFVELKKSGEL
ncbi:TraG family conjugative transposon ATPase [Larkinella harenae]